MALVEKQSNKQIKMLRTDRGGEYLSNRFRDYCKEKGIRRQLTIRYSPQQNGVAERKNRTIVEMARSMLKGKGLSNDFWAEAVNTAVYILNISPTKAVFNKTPYEAWYKKKPDVQGLRVFGCIAYSLIPAQRREKFDEKGEKLIFLGYSEESKGYRLYNPATKDITISRDVIFEETGRWFPDEKSPQSPANNVPLYVPEFSDDSKPAEDFELIEGTTDTSVRRIRSIYDVYDSCNVAFFTGEPQYYEEAAKEQTWRKAMDEEISTIETNNTWHLVDRPTNKDVIGVKWVFKRKYNEDGSVQKHKARLVAKGYSQQPGVDFTETFSPVARMETIRTVLALAAQLQLPVYQLDVKSAFLNGELKEEVYVEQPQGYVIKGKEDKVYRLVKALYGLKQAPRAWNAKIDGYFHKKGFLRSKSEPSLYVKKSGTHDFLIACLYVDDLIYVGTNADMVEDFKNSMKEEFEMTDLGLMKYFLGIQVKQSKGEIFLSQERYVDGLLKKFRMEGCNPMKTPMATNQKLQLDDGSDKVDERLYRSLVGSLIYLTNTRPDIVQSVSLLSRFMHNPSRIHYAVAKRVLRYLKGTKNHGLKYVHNEDNRLIGYTESDWGGSLDDGKSTSGYVFFLGTNAISWSSKKQKTTALSSTEAEYVSATQKHHVKLFG